MHKLPKLIRRSQQKKVVEQIWYQKKIHWVVNWEKFHVKIHSSLAVQVKRMSNYRLPPIVTRWFLNINWLLCHGNLTFDEDFFFLNSPNPCGIRTVEDGSGISLYSVFPGFIKKSTKLSIQFITKSYELPQTPPIFPLDQFNSWNRSKTHFCLEHCNAKKWLHVWNWNLCSLNVYFKCRKCQFYCLQKNKFFLNWLSIESGLERLTADFNAPLHLLLSQLSYLCIQFVCFMKPLTLNDDSIKHECE